MILPSQNRLKGNEQIESIKKKGKAIQDAFFGVLYLENTDGVPKFAFVISTKISKLAVHRNRINRSLHEGVRRSLAMVPKNYDYVFLVKKSIETKSTQEIIREVESFFNNNKTI